jgi:hypothetical protein
VPALIGLHGRQRAGKDTAFGFVQEWATERGVHAARRGFADLLKLSCARLFDPTFNHMEAISWCNRLKFDGMLTLKVRLDGGDTTNRSVVETINVSGRALLQRFGTESHRDVFGDDFWVDALLPTGFEPTAIAGWSSAVASGEASKPETHLNPLWVKSFTDGPFVENIPQVCVITDVRFENEAQRIKALGGEVWHIDRWTESSDSHSSEKILPGHLIDYTIVNNSAIDHFRDMVREVCNDRVELP